MILFVIKPKKNILINDSAYWLLYLLCSIIKLGGYEIIITSKDFDWKKKIKIPVWDYRMLGRLRNEFK